MTGPDKHDPIDAVLFDTELDVASADGALALAGAIGEATTGQREAFLASAAQEDAHAHEGGPFGHAHGLWALEHYAQAAADAGEVGDVPSGGRDPVLAERGWLDAIERADAGAVGYRALASMGLAWAEEVGRRLATSVEGALGRLGGLGALRAHGRWAEGRPESAAARGVLTAIGGAPITGVDSSLVSWWMAGFLTQGDHDRLTAMVRRDPAARDLWARALRPHLPPVLTVPRFADCFYDDGEVIVSAPVPTWGRGARAELRARRDRHVGSDVHLVWYGGPHDRPRPGPHLVLTAGEDGVDLVAKVTTSAVPSFDELARVPEAIESAARGRQTRRLIGLCTFTEGEFALARLGGLWELETAWRNDWLVRMARARHYLDTCLDEDGGVALMQAAVRLDDAMESLSGEGWTARDVVAAADEEQVVPDDIGPVPPSDGWWSRQSIDEVEDSLIVAEAFASDDVTEGTAGRQVATLALADLQAAIRAAQLPEPAPPLPPSPLEGLGACLAKLVEDSSNYVRGFRQELPRGGATLAALSADGAPQLDLVGEVLVPMVLRDDRSSGKVVTLRVGRRAGPGASTGTSFGHHGWAACRAGFFAAQARMHGRLPPAPIADHVITVKDGHGSAFEIDGPSLGAAAFVAFFCGWTGQRAPSDVVVTASLDGDQLKPVDGVPAKLEAAMVVGATRAIVATTQEVPAGVGIAVERCNTVDDVLRALGLTLPTSDRWRPSIPSGNEAILVLLEELVRHVKQQDIEPHRGRAMDPWLVLADRMKLLLDAVDASALQAPQRKRYASAAAYCGIAYQHGAETRLAAAVLEHPAVSSSTEPVARATSIAAKLGKLIVPGCVRSDEGDALDQQLADAYEKLADHDEVRGSVAGTRGRYRMHTGRVTDALPFLEAGLAHHVDEARGEVPRSRCYLAMALRLLGRFDDALFQHDLALEELEHLVRESPAYATSTTMYVLYELARCLVGAGRAGDAVPHARAALDLATSLELVWPRPGILRTLTWARRESGDADGASAALAELRGRYATWEVFIREAEGPSSEGTEVY